MEQLGIEPLQLATQVFNFIVMAAILTYFLYKPILKMLKERRDKIAEGLTYAEKTKAEAEKTEAKRAAVVAAAKEEGAAIIEEAKKTAKLVEADIITKAHDEAAAIVAKGREDIEMERIDLEKKLKDQMVGVAAAVAEKVLSSVISARDHHSIIDKKIRTIAKELQKA